MDSQVCLGVFKAQQFHLLSGDPNTIFQFLVFPDRLILMRVGSAFNQLLQVATANRVGVVGLKDFAAGGLPTLREASEALRSDQAPQAMRVEMPSTKSREILVSSLESCELRERGLFKKGLNVTLLQGGKYHFRFLAPEEVLAARALLTTVLGSKFTVVT